MVVPSVLNLAILVKSTDVADADTAGIVARGMGANLANLPAVVYRAVKVDDEVVADLRKATLAVHLVYLFHGQALPLL